MPYTCVPHEGQNAKVGVLPLAAVQVELASAPSIATSSALKMALFVGPPAAIFWH
jgi:hypothetical protein